jgi:hypothetical protein
VEIIAGLAFSILTSISRDLSAYIPMTTLTFSLRLVLELTDDQFYQMCQVNRDLRLEQTAQG